MPDSDDLQRQSGEMPPFGCLLISGFLGVIALAIFAGWLDRTNERPEDPVVAVPSYPVPDVNEEECVAGEGTPISGDFTFVLREIDGEMQPVCVPSDSIRTLTPTTTNTPGP